MADKNFIVKNGLEVGGQEVVSSSGVVTSAALGGQTLASTDSPTFNNLTISNDLAVSGDLNLTGDLNITGDVNTLSVTDLDVTDQTITLGAGQVESASGGSGIVVDGSGASILWDETNTEWDFNNSINVTGTGQATRLGLGVAPHATAGLNITNTNQHIRLNNGSELGIIHVLSTGELELWGHGDGESINFRTGSGAGTVAMNIVGNNVGITNTSTLNANLHIGSASATGDATNPALQIGGASTYRLGIYTSTEGAVIANANGDDGIQFVVKTAGEAMRIDGGTGNVGIGTSSPSYPFHVTGNGDTVAAVTGGASSIAALNLGNSTNLADGGIRYDNSADALIFRASNAEKMRIDSTGKIGIGIASPDGKLHVLSGSAGTVTAATDANELVLEATSNVGMTLLGGNSSIARIRFGDADSNARGNIFYNHSNDSLGIQTAASTAMTIDSSQNVGIGTSSPTQKLDVNGNIAVGYDSSSTHQILKEYATNHASANRGGILQLGIYDGSFAGIKVVNAASSVTNYNSQYISFETHEGAVSVAERMRITSTGDVGIGTISPSSKFHVYQATGELTPRFEVGDGSVTALRLINNSAHWRAGIQSTSNYVIRNVTNNRNDLSINGSDGNVGIGTTSPTHKLEVAGGSFGFNLGTGNLGNHYFILNAGTSNDGGFILKRDNSNQYQIVNNASGNLTIYQYANSKEIFNIDTAGTTNFYGDAIKLPTGGTSDRPSTAVIGMMRYNTDLDVVEIYDSVSTEWRAMQVGAHAEAPRFINPTTYHQDHFKIIGPTGQRADADFNSGYGAVTLNCSFTGNFTVLSKWSHDYMGIGIGYKDNFYNSAFTGESNDGNGPYGGTASVDGFDSSVSYMGQYHWPVTGQGSTTAGTTYYIKHQRSGNTISTHYSTNSAAEYDKDHSSWSQVQSTTVSSNNECKPLWGEAAGNESVKLHLNYVEGEYHTKNYSGNQEIVN
jgi:hypothetical protein